MLPDKWMAPPERFTFLTDEVHIWRANLEFSETRIDFFERLLSEDEIGRAERFHFPEHRSRFIAGRGILRTVLSQYLNIPPQNLSFCYNEYGRPMLDRNVKGLTFNLAHSQDTALYAVAAERDIGIDVEAVRSDFDYVSIARRFFAPSETEALLSYSADQQAEAFFRCWTRKESYIKAKGKGLSLPLQDFTVSLEVAERTKVLTSPHTEDWFVFHLSPFPGYVGALAAEGNTRLHFWSFQ